jgi:hypothetical protein
MHPLSVGQEALWFFHQLSGDTSAYNVTGAVNLHFPVDVPRLTAAVQATVSRHSMVNCVFAGGGGDIRRRPGALGPEPLLEVYDWDGNDVALRAFALQLSQRPFRLDRQPPIRLALLRRPDAPDVLLLAAHHIAVDYHSQLLILRRILAAYAAEPGAAPDDTDTGGDFDEFVRAQRAYLDSPRAATAAAYWRRELQRAGAVGDLPADLPRPPVYRFAGSEVGFPLPDGLPAEVERAAAAAGTTVFGYLLSVFQLLLYAFSGHTDHLIGYPVSLRPPRYAESIGYFVNTLPLHARIDPDASFPALLRRTGGKVLRGLLHRDYPYALMPRLSDVRRAPDQAGLFATMFVLTGPGPDQPWSALPLPGTRTEVAGLGISEFYLPQQQGQFDLTLQVFRHPAGTHAVLKYNTSLFTARTAGMLADGYVRLVRAATGGTLPQRLSDVHPFEKERDPRQ